MRLGHVVIVLGLALVLAVAPGPFGRATWAAIDAPTLLTSGTPTNNATSYATSSVSPAARSLLIVTVLGVDAAVAALPNITVSGLSLTWTQRSPVDNNPVRATVWTAYTGASPGSGAITIASNLTLTGLIYRVEQMTHAHATTPVVQSVNNPAGISATLSAFGSAANGTWAAAFGPDTSGTNVFSAGTGFTLLGNTGHIDDDLGFELILATEYRVDNDTTPDAVANGTLDGAAMIAMELQPAPPAAVPGALINTPLSY